MTSPNQTPDALREAIQATLHRCKKCDVSHPHTVTTLILVAIAPFLAPPLAPVASTTGKGEARDEVETLKRALQRESQRADYALDALAACLAQVGGEIFIDDTTVHRLGLPRPDVYDQREEEKGGRKLWVKLPARTTSEDTATPPPSQGAEGSTPRTEGTEAVIAVLEQMEAQARKDGRQYLWSPSEYVADLSAQLASARAELAEAKGAHARCTNSVIEASLAFPNVGAYIAQVETQLATALRERDEEQRMRQTMETRHGEVLADLTALRAQVEEARKDGERLNELMDSHLVMHPKAQRPKWLFDNENMLLNREEVDIALSAAKEAT